LASSDAGQACTLPRVGRAEGTAPASNGTEGPSEGGELARLRQKREAKLAELQKLEGQLQRSREGLGREARASTSARAEAGVLLERAKGLSLSLQGELGRIRSQQQQLKDLRARVRELQGAAPRTPREPQVHSVEAEMPKTPRTERSAGSGPAPAPASRGSSRGRETLRSGETLPGQPAAHAVDATLEGLLMDVQHVRSVFGGSRPEGRATAAKAGLPRPGDTPRRRSRGEEEEAEIQLLRPGGVPVARLRHPGGSEALVDLRSGLVCSWRLEGAGEASPGHLVLLWPRVLDEAGAPPWRVTLLEDSNNEPSVTVSCGGDGHASWLVRRTLTLAAAALHERLTIENLATEEEVSFSVGERAATSTEDAVQELAQAAASAFQPRATATVEPVVVVPPGGRWSLGRSWTP